MIMSICEPNNINACLCDICIYACKRKYCGLVHICKWPECEPEPLGCCKCKYFEEKQSNHYYVNYYK